MLPHGLGFDERAKVGQEVVAAAEDPIAGRVRLRDGSLRGQDDERGLARESGHLAEAGEGDPDLPAIDRLDGGRKDLDDRRVEGVEGAVGVTPLQREEGAPFEPGRLGHALADKDRDLAASGGGGEEGRRDVEHGLARVDALDLDRIEAAFGVDRALGDENGHGLAGGGQGGERGGNRAVGVGEGQRVVGIVGRVLEVAPADLGGDHGLLGLFVHPLDQALGEDDQNERERKDEDVEPGPEARTEEVLDGQPGEASWARSRAFRHVRPRRRGRRRG